MYIKHRSFVWTGMNLSGRVTWALSASARRYLGLDPSVHGGVEDRNNRVQHASTAGSGDTNLNRVLALDAAMPGI
jgi:hypothetical protein